MKDARGHGSGGGFKAALANYAAHQSGIIGKVPNVEGQTLYQSMMKHAQSLPKSQTGSGWAPNELADLARA